MITPIELLGKELKRGFGYKAIEVDEFLEEVARDYEKVYKENNELKERVSALTENLDHYRVIEESLKKALVLGGNFQGDDRKCRQGGQSHGRAG